MWIKSSDGKAFINFAYMECVSISDGQVNAFPAENNGDLEAHWILFRGTLEEARKYYDWLITKLRVEETMGAAAALRQTIIPPPPSPPPAPPPRVMVEGVPYSMTPEQYWQWRKKRSGIRRIFSWLFHKPSSWE
jgi:hypothetical protein